MVAPTTTTTWFPQHANILVGISSIVIFRAIWQRYQWICQMKQLPGPSLRDTSLTHWFFAHLGPIIRSIGTIAENPEYPNSMPFYLNWVHAFSDFGFFRLFVFHPYWVPFLPQGAVFIYDADMARQLLEDRNNTQKLIKVKSVYEIAAPLVGDSFLGMADTPTWKHQRKRAAASFTQQLLERVCQITVDLLEDKVFPQWETKSKDEATSQVPIEATKLTSRLTLEVLGIVAFGHSFQALETGRINKGDNEEDGYTTSTLYDSFVGMLAVLTRRTLSIPHLYKLTRREENAKFEEASMRLNRVVEQVVQTRLDAEMKAEQTSVEDEDCPKDLLDYLLCKDDEGRRLPRKYILGNVRMFCFAGHDTTASTLANGFWFLATNLKVQQRLQVELDDFYSTNSSRHQSQKQLNQLRYLDAVVRECLRLVGPGVAGRTSTDTIQLRGRDQRMYTFPKGIQFFVAPFMGQRCEAYWKDASSFCPERFLDDSRAGPWFPFSIGPRNCVGQPMAVVELKSILAHIFHNYTVRPQPGAKPPINTVLLTVKPTEVYVTVERRLRKKM